MMLVILSTAIGTFTGVIATLTLMQRKGRYLASGDDLIARQRIPDLERSVAAATAAGEELRKQSVAQAQTIQQNREELEKKQQEFDVELSRRTALEQQVEPLAERVRELTAQVADEKRQKEELAGWNVTLTAQAGQQNEAAAEQMREAEARTAAERQAVLSELESVKRERDALSGKLIELEAKAASERLAVWAELDGVRRENEGLTTQLKDLKARSEAEIEAERKAGEEWERRHAELSARAGQQAGSLSEQLQALERKLADDRLRFEAELDSAHRENAALDSELQRERASAAEGIELLSMAHKKFSGVFEMRFSEAHTNGGNGHHAPNGNGNGNGNGECLPVPALALARDDEAVYEFARAEPHLLSEVAGD